jgi:hypothetical protein
MKIFDLLYLICIILLYKLIVIRPWKRYFLFDLYHLLFNLSGRGRNFKCDLLIFILFLCSRKNFLNNLLVHLVLALHAKILKLSMTTVYSICNWKSILNSLSINRLLSCFCSWLGHFNFNLLSFLCFWFIFQFWG